MEPCPCTATASWAEVPAGLNRQPLVVSDADGTLFEQEVIEELAFEAGTLQEVAAITAEAMNGRMDFAESLHRRVATLEGLDEEAFARVRARMRVSTGTNSLINRTHQAGGKFAVVSGGFVEVVDPIESGLGVDYVLANRLEVSGGVLTGKLASEVVGPNQKVWAIASWKASSTTPVVAIGDGANDIPMLSAANFGVAFCPKPALARVADTVMPWRNLGSVWGFIGNEMFSQTVH